MFKKIIEWFANKQMNEIDRYISSRNPTCTADIDRIINEFNYKRSLHWF